MALLRPLLMQASGADSTFPYSAQEHRQLVQGMLAEGVLGQTDLRVSQRAAGANFTVDVAAGKAVVVGDSVAAQGSYLVTNDAPITDITIPAAPASGTRTHRVVLKVQDRAHDGGVAAGTYNAQVQVVEDTGGGLPALPLSAVPLATVTVTSTTTSITDASITDSRVRVESPGAPRVVSGTTVLAGTAPTGAARFITQAGTFVGTTGASLPDVTMTFPQAFPNGVLSVVVSNGDPVAVSNGATPHAHAVTLSTVTFRWLNGSGAGLLNAAVRQNYIAVGW